MLDFARIRVRSGHSTVGPRNFLINSIAKQSDRVQWAHGNPVVKYNIVLSSTPDKLRSSFKKVAHARVSAGTSQSNMIVC